jgi:hypothetical protein
MTRSPGITQTQAPLLIWLSVPLFVLVIACIIAVTIQATGWDTVRLFRHGAQTAGVVTAAPTRESTVEYEFEVGGKKYRGGGYRGPVRGSAATFKEWPVGRPLKIFYLPSNPQISSAADPAENLQGVAGLVICLVLVPAFFIWRAKRMLATPAGSPSLLSSRIG